MTYDAAGVSITAGNELVDRIRALVKSTAIPGYSSDLGGFGGVFDLSEAGYKESPLLVTGTDGVGTKLQIAQAINKHDTVGIDLVAMNVNDLIVQGARPLYLTDVFSCSKLDVSIAEDVIKGICDGCKEAGCALMGGETAEMPGFFVSGRYDVVGASTGAITRGKKLLPQKNAMKEGDVLLGLASNGCHSNGFSLIRKIIEKAHLEYSDQAPWDKGKDRGPEPTHTDTYLRQATAQNRGARSGERHGSHYRGRSLGECPSDAARVVGSRIRCSAMGVPRCAEVAETGRTCQ